MPTVRTVTVKSSGGDYSSLSAAEAAEQGNLVSLDRQLDIACYNFDDTTAVVIDGSTTDSTRYIRVYAVDSHGGKYGTAAYRNTGGGGFQPAINVADAYTRLVGLQIAPSNTSFSSGIRVTAGGTNVLIDSCICKITNLSPSNSLGYAEFAVQENGCTIRNCVGTGGSCGLYTTNDPILQNCTFGNGAAYGIDPTYGTPTLTNCYVGNYGNGPYAFGATCTTCAHNSSASQTGSTANISYSTSNFVSTTAGSEDLHLVSGASSTLKTGGTSLSGSFTTDIDGETRSGSWSIGADSIVSAVIEIIRQEQIFTSFLRSTCQNLFR
jgi:hypothetical protein